MRRSSLVLIITTAVLLLTQISFSGLVPFVTPNLMLAYFIVLANFYDYRLLAWLALVCGTILDLYGPSQTFGLSIGLLLLTVVVAKFVINLQDQNQRLLMSVLLTIGLSVLSVLLQFATIFTQVTSFALKNIGIKLLLYSIYNSFITIVLYTSFEYLSQRSVGYKRLAAKR